MRGGGVEIAAKAEMPALKIESSFCATPAPGKAPLDLVFLLGA